MKCRKSPKKRTIGNRRKNPQNGRKKNTSFRRKRSKPNNSVSNAVNAGPSRNTCYSVLNTQFSMDQGNAAASVARGLLALCFKLDADNLKSQYLDEWIRTGEKIVVLKGYDHKHLKYLQEEVRFTAIATETLYRKWGKGQAILVLTVFGQEEELEETFQGLSLLR